jgi:HNH endonuclease/AP2 domain
MPPASYLHECLSYNPDSGEVVWRKRPSDHFESAVRHAQWNTRYAGKTAGARRKNGHIHIAIDDRLYLAHRVIWKMMTGEEPARTIDHEDRNKINNRWKNLRKATHSDQGWNRTAPKNNTTGHRGVSFRPSGRFRSYVSINGKQHTIGTFNTVEEANQARRAIAMKIAGDFYCED